MAAAKVRILIPPSEGKQPGGDHPPLKDWPDGSEEMLTRLAKVKSAEWEKLLGVKGKVLAQAVAANREIRTAPTLPAIERYSGVVYTALDYPSLKKSEQDFLNRYVRIVSAVFGLVRPDQLIPDYKLKIDKLGADKLWSVLTVAELEKMYVIDLLPKAHRKAVTYASGCAPEFLFIKDGKPKPAGHSGKHIKGRFIRFLAEQQITDPSGFHKFREDGFRFVDGHFVKKL